MNYKRKLTLAQLIREMHNAAVNFGRLVQRDTITDIADIVECHDNAFKNNTYFERYWGIKHSGTIMSRTSDFGEWESYIEVRYRIMWSENSNWTFEEL